MVSIHLLLGPEQGEKSAHIERLVEIVRKHAGGDPEVHNFYSFDTSVLDVVRVLRNGSLFYPHVVAVLNGVEEIKKKEETSALGDYIRRPAPNATLILTSPAVRVDAAWAKAVPADARKTFWEMFENQKQAWVLNCFRRLGVTIETDAADLLLDMVENNTRDLRTAAERLCGFVGRGGTVSSGEIEQFLFHSKEESTFSLFDEIAEGTLESALDICQTLMLSSDQNPTGILAGLVWQFKRLHAFSVLLDQRYSSDEAFTRLGIRSKRNQHTFNAAAKRYDRRSLESILARAVEYDALFRSIGPAQHRGLLQQFLFNVMVRRGAAHLSPSVVFGS
jgi:DNA polymerase III subunit delta